MTVSNEDEARRAAARTYGQPNAFEAFTGEQGTVLGWTFAATTRPMPGYGWVLVDGRVSPATEDYRSYAENYGRGSVNS